jgi:hypothetical protein
LYNLHSEAATRAIEMQTARASTGGRNTKNLGRVDGPGKGEDLGGDRLWLNEITHTGVVDWATDDPEHHAVHHGGLGARAQRRLVADSILVHGYSLQLGAGFYSRVIWGSRISPIMIGRRLRGGNGCGLSAA